ncbi:hypothetical protein N8303_05645 [Gammaproteobacteria bacterium]|nr:hypothetical protein [Gammaproteobacteria bacterium]
MPIPIIEFVGWALWEFFFAILFYNTGSAIIRLVSLGKVKFPLISPNAFKKEKPQIRNASSCYLVGMVLYMSLAVIWLTLSN